MVVLGRVEPGIVPDYCTHGRATCVACPEWVWLGSKTVAIVESGKAVPMCVQCATRLIPPCEPVGRIHDHKRTEGPHDD